MFNRRQLSLGVAAATTVLSSGCQSVAVVPKQTTHKVGLQTYTVRVAFEEDPLATFKMIKNAGYDYVELNSRNFEKLSTSELKAMLDETGLYAPATHISLASLESDLPLLFENAKQLDMTYLVVPYIDENQRKLEDWKAHAASMNDAGEQLADAGVKLAYHNHQFEFEDLGGQTTAMDILLNECAPENLTFELDFFWATLADADIKKLFMDNPGRFKLCHIKDMGPNKQDFAGASYGKITSELMQNVGEGIIPFEQYLQLNDVSGMEYFIAEHDNPSKPYATAIETSLNAVRNFKF
ncbi:MAG: sugar phosphate isomerase/epimerase [Acidimicrobiales bacterium]|nr:sugar phosphate isomerase/epimerase [Hyphomonadaceae bacterium]RZV36342.1 MAG: sugar phosphate isomerase/epimerase [Acidimicrobiales bacterium]